MKKVLLLFLLANSLSQEKISKPSFISFETGKDSFFVYAKNPLRCPTFLILTNLKTEKDSIINFEADQQQLVSKFTIAEMDSSSFLKNFKARMLYGSFPAKEPDANFNYQLPFPKGKKYKVIQGNFGKFSHSTPYSQYAIDFKMNEGQTVCAMRAGIVAAVKEDSNIGGKSMKYYDDANYILLYHEDGTFSQYVHLKHKGSLVKVGDKVKMGQPIGYSGNTGYSSTPHLHFGVFRPTLHGFVSIPYTLNAIPSQKYKKGKFAIHR